MAEAAEPEQTVFIVDDDAAIRNSLRRLLSPLGLKVQTFPSGQAFLEGVEGTASGCLVLDVRMPGMSGLELQERLAARGHLIPVIVITAYGDVPMAVRSMKLGAIDFVEKPVRPQVLLDRVHEALEKDRAAAAHRAEIREIQRRLALLTPREDEVLGRVLDGRTSREIAEELRLSPKTIHTHRAAIMRKMRVDSVAELASRVAAARGASNSG